MAIQVYQFVDAVTDEPKGAGFPLCPAHQVSQKIPEGMKLKSLNIVDTRLLCDECNPQAFRAHMPRYFKSFKDENADRPD